MEALSDNAGSGSCEGIFRFKFMVGKREGNGSGGCTKVTGRQDWKGPEGQQPFSRMFLNRELLAFEGGNSLATRYLPL